MKANNSLVYNQNLVWSYVVFFIWPVMSFFLALKNFGSRYSGAIIILFYGLFGYTFIYNDASDSSRHAKGFINIAEKPFSDFFDIIGGLYSEGSGKPDFFMDFIGFTVSRFTNDTRLYFCILTIVIAFALFKNLKFFHNVYLTNKNIIGLLFLMFFFILMPPSRILSFRHYTALLVFTYGVYNYLNTNNKTYVFLILCTGFIHFGFLMTVALFFIYLGLGKRNKAYYILIVLSFIFFDQAASLLRQYGIGLDIGLEQTVRGYTHEKYLDRVSGFQENRNVIINSYNRWTTLFFIIVIIYHKIKFKTFDAVSEKLYSFLLLFFVFVNFTQGIESITNRFSIVFQVLCCIFFIHLYAKNSFKYSVTFKYASIGFILLNLFVITRVTIEYTNVILIVPFLPVSLLADSQTTILNLIK